MLIDFDKLLTLDVLDGVSKDACRADNPLSSRTGNLFKGYCSDVPHSDDLIARHRTRVTKETDWIKLVERCNAKYILVALSTGFGKSSNISRLGTDRRVLYCCSQPDKVVDASLKQFKRLPTKHAKSFDNCKRDVNGDIIHTKEAFEYTQYPTGNCKYSYLHRELISKQYNVSVCKQCPIRTQCAQGEGDGYGFLYQVSKAQKHERRLRLHINSLQQTAETDLLVIDECYSSADPVCEVIVPWKEFKNIRFFFDLVSRSLYQLADKYVTRLHIEANKGFGINTLQVKQVPLGFELTTELQEQLLDAEEQYLQKYMKGMYRGHHQLPTNWVSLWLSALVGTKIQMFASAAGVSFYERNARVQANIQNAGQVLFLDATMTARELSVMYDIPESEIATLYSEPATNNLLITIDKRLGFEVTNYLTQEQIGQVRADMEQHRAEDTGIITWKSLKGEKDLTLLSESRGSNKLKSCRTIYLYGIPTINWGAARAYYATFGDTREFRAYYHNKIKSELIQAIGRIRAENRTEFLEVVIKSNLDTRTFSTAYMVREIL